MNTASTNLQPGTAGTVVQTVELNPGYFSSRSVLDWLFALALAMGGGFALFLYGHHMDGYEKGILIGTVPVMIRLGWF